MTCGHCHFSGKPSTTRMSKAKYLRILEPDCVTFAFVRIGSVYYIHYWQFNFFNIFAIVYMFSDAQIYNVYFTNSMPDFKYISLGVAVAGILSGSDLGELRVLKSLWVTSSSRMRHIVLPLLPGCDVSRQILCSAAAWWQYVSCS